MFLFRKGRRTPLVLAIVTIPLTLLLAGLAPLPAGWPAELPLWSILLGEAQGYVIWAGTAFLLAWLLLHPLLPHRQLARRRWPKIGQVVQEVAFSLSTQAVFIAVALWVSFTDQWGIGKAYDQISDYGLPYAVFVTFLILVIDDTWFHWSHRAMHHPWLFDRVHRVHHESVDPTPFTAFSFHPLEAMIHGLGSLSILVVVLILPHHVASIAAAGMVQLVFNLIGHLGYEVYPRGWNRWPVLRWKTSAMHHDMHHQRSGGNYGLYFRWWDKLCGTEFRDYEERYEALFDKAPKTGRPALSEP